MSPCAAVPAPQVRRQDEEKRRILKERRENGSLPDLGLVETNNDTGFEDDDLEEEEEGPPIHRCTC